MQRKPQGREVIVGLVCSSVISIFFSNEHTFLLQFKKSIKKEIKSWLLIVGSPRKSLIDKQAESRAVSLPIFSPPRSRHP